MCTHAIIVYTLPAASVYHAALPSGNRSNIVWFLCEVERRRKIHCGFLFKIHWNQAKICPTCKVDISFQWKNCVCPVHGPASQLIPLCWPRVCYTMWIHTYISNIEFFFSSSFVFFQFRSKPAWFRCRTCICSELRMTRNISFTYQMDGCLFFFSACCFSLLFFFFVSRSFTSLLVFMRQLVIIFLIFMLSFCTGPLFLVWFRCLQFP